MSNTEIYMRLEWNEATQQMEIKERIVRPVTDTIYDKKPQPEVKK